MIEEVQEALELAQPLLEKIDQAVEGGARLSYEILLRQQYVKVAQVGLGWLFWLAFMIWMISKDINEGGLNEIDVLLFLVLGVLPLVLLAGQTLEVVGILINPDYYVVKEVISLLGR
jgi:hypothetical protein